MKLILSFTLCAFACYGQTNFYVSTTGNDSAAGTIGAPFLTLEGAQTAIQSLRSGAGLPTGGVVVNLRGGRYYRKTVFSLSGTNDSGEVTKPIIYQSYPGETAYIIGGTVVTNFVAVTNTAVLNRLTASAQTNVLVADLAAQGVTNLGIIIPHGYANSGYNDALSSTLWQSELIFNDQAMTLARRPNTSWSTAVTNAVVTNSSFNTFGYTNVIPIAWAEPTNVWIHGYWYYDYSDSMEQVESIDTGTKTIVMVSPGTSDRIRVGDAYNAGGRYYFFNVLEELDTAGEYYIDRLTTNLYFWPTTTITNGSCVVSTVSTNLIVLTGVSNVVLSGIAFEAAKMAFVNINTGESNLITGCVFRAGASDAVKILASPRTGVSGCNVSDMGERGLWIFESGDRPTLISGSNFITGNTVSNVSRLLSASRDALRVTGGYGNKMNVVGSYIGHNLVNSLPHQAIHFYGNNNVIEYNEIHHVCTETADSGAIYCGSDPTFYGNIIRYNYIHDVTIGGGANDYDGVKGIYLDGAMNGVTMFGNVLANVDHGIHVNGGRDNVIQNNIFVDCTNYLATKWPSFAININQSALENGFTNITSSYWQRLTNIPYQGTLWSNAYPNLARITNGPYVPNINICIATNNTVANNISFSNLVWILWQDQGAPVPQSADLTNSVVSNNLTNTDPLFVNYAARDFNLQPSSPAWALGWVRIPLELIGPNPRYPTVGNVQTLRVGTMRMAQ